jgi:hypothetical protein
MAWENTEVHAYGLSRVSLLGFLQGLFPTATKEELNITVTVPSSLSCYASTDDMCLHLVRP